MASLGHKARWRPLPSLYAFILFPAVRAQTCRSASVKSFGRLEGVRKSPRNEPAGPGTSYGDLRFRRPVLRSGAAPRVSRTLLRGCKTPTDHRVLGLPRRSACPFSFLMPSTLRWRRTGGMRIKQGKADYDVGPLASVSARSKVIKRDFTIDFRPLKLSSANSKC